MKNLIIILFVALTINLSAQKNSLRLGLFGLAFEQFNFKYEREIVHNISLGATIGVFVPNSFPALETVLTQTVPNKAEDIKLRFGGFSINPELRLYISVDGGLDGFYFSPIIHYTNNTLDFIYIDDNDEFLFDSRIDGLGGSLNIGNQWVIGSGFTIDWTILGLGAKYYNSSSTITLKNSALNITDDEAKEIEDALKDIEYIGKGVGEVTFDSDNNSLNIKIGALAPVLRTSLSLGWTF